MTDDPTTETEIPDDTPTQPNLRQVTCPDCRGQRRVMRTQWVGTRHSSVFGPCTTCDGVGNVTADQQRAFHAAHPKRRPTMS